MGAITSAKITFYKISMYFARINKHALMKKTILSLVAVGLMATAANAQIAIAPELGLNLSDISAKSQDPAGGTHTTSTSMRPGLAVGAIVDIGITGNIFFQPGLFYEMTGAKSTDAPQSKININTLVIPLNFEYKFGVAGGNRFFAGVGPYIGYNISGKETWDADPANYIPAGSHTLTFGSDKGSALGTGDDLKALDLGLGLNVGYLLSNGFYVRAHYQMGLTNLLPGGDDKNSFKTSAFGLTVGYYLTGQKGSKKTKGTAKKK
jgi:hypothetical protein